MEISEIDIDPDDELLDTTPQEVLDILGFDPRELDEKPISLCEQIALVLADTCGAGSPGGKGFQRDNTCQRGASGKGGDKTTAEKPDDDDDGFYGLTEGEYENVINDFYEFESPTVWEVEAENLGIDTDTLSEDEQLDEYVRIQSAGIIARRDDVVEPVPPWKPSPVEGDYQEEVTSPDGAVGILQTDWDGYSQAAKEVGLPNMTVDQMAELSGQTDDAATDVAAFVGHEGDDNDPSYSAYIALDTITDEYESQRTIGFDGEDTIIKNMWFQVSKQHQGQGLGTRIFARQIKAAQEAGVDRIETAAARSGSLNGYYTWPRLGYDANLDEVPSWMKNGILDYKPGATKISDLFHTQKDRNWWKKHGNSVALTFDLTPGSLSMRRFKHYLKQKGIKL